MARALLDPGRDPALPSPRRRAPRPPARHRARDGGDGGRLGPRGRGLARGDLARAPQRALSGDGHGLPVHAEPGRVRGPRGLPRRLAPHGLLARGRRRPDGPAGGRGGHGLVGDRGDPRDRQAGRAPDGLPAHRELLDPGLERPDQPRAGGGPQGPLPRDARPGPHRRHGRHLAARPRQGTGPHPGGARGRARAALAPGLLLVPQRLRGHDDGPRGEPDRRRLRAPQDQGDRQGPRDGRAPLPQGPPARHEAPLRRPRLLRHLQPPQRRPRRRQRRRSSGSPRTGSSPTARSTPST